jgi:regulator of sigma E protease
MTTNIFAFVVVLGILIFFHELGHFLVARLFGVGVEKFSLGFGPRLFGRTVGITDYRISAIPLGGYVKMVGDEPDAELDRN